MRVIVCVDDSLGMLFAGKRQSRDSRVLDDIKNHFEPIVILPFSEKLLSSSGVKYTVKNSINDVCDTETVFIESIDPASLEGKIDELILYKWNRRYPSDMRLTLDLKKFKKSSICEFTGTSHDKITREVYKK